MTGVVVGAGGVRGQGGELTTSAKERLSRRNGEGGLGIVTGCVTDAGSAGAVVAAVGGDAGRYALFFLLELRAMDAECGGRVRVGCIDGREGGTLLIGRAAFALLLRARCGGVGFSFQRGSHLYVSPVLLLSPLFGSLICFLPYRARRYLSVSRCGCPGAPCGIHWSPVGAHPFHSAPVPVCPSGSHWVTSSGGQCSGLSVSDLGWWALRSDRLPVLSAAVGSGFPQSSLRSATVGPVGGCWGLVAIHYAGPLFGSSALSARAVDVQSRDRPAVRQPLGSFLCGRAVASAVVLLRSQCHSIRICFGSVQATSRQTSWSTCQLGPGRPRLHFHSSRRLVLLCPGLALGCLYRLGHVAFAGGVHVLSRFILDIEF